MRPTWSSIQLTTLNWEWNIHFQAIVLSAIGIVQGRTNSVRSTLRPGNAPEHQEGQRDAQRDLGGGRDDGDDQRVAQREA